MFAARAVRADTAGPALPISVNPATSTRFAAEPSAIWLNPLVNARFRATLPPPNTVMFWYST